MCQYVSLYLSKSKSQIQCSTPLPPSSHICCAVTIIVILLDNDIILYILTKHVLKCSASYAMCKLPELYSILGESLVTK